MKIVRLEAENVKRLRAVRIVPNPAGNMVVLGGRNAQGKTSALECIEMALGGARRIPGDPVRHGEEKAKIILETDDGLIVSRSFTAAGKTNLVVKAKDGGKHGQELLNGLMAPRSLDPLSFLGMRPAEQVDELLGLVGLNFDELDAASKVLYDKRTDENREVKRANDEVEAIGDISGTPEEPVVVADLLTEQGLRILESDNLKALRKDASDKAQEAFRHSMEVERITGEIAQLKARLVPEEEKQKEATAKAAELVRQANETTVPNLEEIAARIAAAGEENDAYQLRVRKKEAEENAEDLQKKADALTNQIDEIEEEKRRQLASATFPVEGLGFDAGQVMYQGVSFSQASRAEQIRVATAMAFAANPGLKIALVRDGSVLDDESLAIMGAVAAKAGGQLWVEMARGAPDGSFIIEDGLVVE